MKKEKLSKLENLALSKFQNLDVEKMSRLKGGYTLNTATIYSSGGGKDDGDDGITND